MDRRRQKRPHWDVYPTEQVAVATCAFGACMTDKIEKIVLYRSHASTLRSMAQQVEDAEMRMTLVTLADDFERIATGLNEQRARRHK